MNENLYYKISQLFEDVATFESIWIDISICDNTCNYNV